MAVRALGAGQLVDSEGTWPTNYVNFANENEILDNVNAIYTAVASRMNAAIIVANTLETDIWAKTKATTNNEITWEKQDGKTILSETLKIDVYKDGNISNIDVKDRKLDWASIAQVLVDDKNTADPTDDVYGPAESLTSKEVADSVELSTLKTAMAYDVWYNTKDKKIVAVFKTEDSKVKTVEFTSIAKAGDEKITVVVDGKEVKYDLHKNSGTVDTSVYENHDDDTDVTYATFAAYSDEKLENTFGTLVLSNNKVTDIYEERYTVAKLVKEVTDSKIKFDTFATNKISSELQASGVLTSELKFTDENIKLFITKDGKEIKAEDIEKDDVVFAYKNGSNVYYLNVVDNKVEGTVKSVGSTYITVDGTKYEVAEGLKANMPSAKDEVELFLLNDKVYAYKFIEKTSEYAVVKSLEVVNSRKGLDLEVVLQYFDGTKSDALTLDLDVKAGKFGQSISDNVETCLAADSATAANSNIKTNGYYGEWDDDSDPLTADVPVISVQDIVKYEIKGDKVALELVGAATASAKGVLAITGFNAGKSKVYFTTGSQNIYVDDDTEVIIVKQWAAGDDKDSVKVSKVSVADLDTDTFTAAAVGVKADATEADYIVIFDDPARSNKSDDWMMVLEVATIDEDDFNEEITLVDAKGNKTVVKGDNTSVALADLGIASISGDELTEVLDDTDYDGHIITPANDLYIYKVEDGVMYLADKNGATITRTSEVMSDDVLYVEATLDGLSNYETLKVSSLSKIDFAEYDKDNNTLDVSDAEKILEIICEEVDTNIYEVVAVIYAK